MDTSLAFERLMSKIHGRKACQIAGQFANPTTRTEWLRTTFRLMQKEVDNIDTTSRQKQMLMRDFQAAIDGLPKSYDPSWEMIFPLISACARFLGYDYSGARVNMPSYWQSSGQKFTQSIFEKGEKGEDEFRETKEDAVTIRARMCVDLRSKGVDTFTIALALNISEGQVKKMIREGKGKKKKKKKSDFIKGQ
jgi:DNA-binding CsgD family transcriptional regulator